MDSIPSVRRARGFERAKNVAARASRRPPSRVRPTSSFFFSTCIVSRDTRTSLEPLFLLSARLARAPASRPRRPDPFTSRCRWERWGRRRRRRWRRRCDARDRRRDAARTFARRPVRLERRDGPNDRARDRPSARARDEGCDENGVEWMGEMTTTRAREDEREGVSAREWERDDGVCRRWGRWAGWTKRRTRRDARRRGRFGARRTRAGTGETTDGISSRVVFVRRKQRRRRVWR